MPVNLTVSGSSRPSRTASACIAVSRSKIMLRAWASRIMLCNQKKDATRPPRVTGVTMCRLEAG